MHRCRVARVGAVVGVGVHGDNRDGVGQHKRSAGHRIVVDKRVLRREQSIHARKLAVLIDVAERERPNAYRATGDNSAASLATAAELQLHTSAVMLSGGISGNPRSPLASASNHK